MEQERIAQENEEREKAEKEAKMKEKFGDANSQWEKDKSALQELIDQDKKPAQAGAYSGPAGQQEQTHAQQAQAQAEAVAAEAAIDAPGQGAWRLQQ